MRTLGQQAKAFRESRGWNTTQMGKAAKTSRQNIESLEAEGNRIPKYIGDLAVAMGRSVDDMLVEAELAPAELARMAAPCGVDWPLELVDQDLYENLTGPEKGFVQSAMLDAIKQLMEKRKNKPRRGKLPSSHEGAKRRAA